jgi:hypothetical protein
MKKIEISEGCFGPDVMVDDESLFMHEYDNRKPEMITDLQDELIDELKSLKDKLGMNDWYQIAEMVVTTSEKYEYDTEESDEGDSCGQCGNYNWKYIYKKVEK